MVVVVVVPAGNKEEEEEDSIMVVYDVVAHAAGREARTIPEYSSRHETALSVRPETASTREKGKMDLAGQ